MRVTNEGPARPLIESPTGVGGSTTPPEDCCDIEPDDQPDIAENPDGLGDSSAHALEDVIGGADDQNLAHGTVSDGGGAPTWTNPTNANDGNPSTFARANTGVLSPGSAYLKTDLGAAYAIGTIVVVGSDNGGVMAAGLTVDWSTNGSSWTATGLSPVVTGGSPWTETYTPSSPITARYWRLVWAHGGGFVNGKDVNTWQLNGPSVIGTAWSLSVPEVIDGDDTTYAEISGTDVVRVDLGAAYRIVRSRLRIGTATSGSKTYTIDAWNELDESDRVTLATFTFTGVGSLTAQDVEIVWFTDDPYRYFELDGPNENRRIFTWSFYEATIATNHQHAAALVSYDNTASGLTADDVQEAIDELAATPAALTDHTHAATGSGSNGGGATLQPGTLDIPVATSPAQTAEGRAVWDSDDDKLTIGTGAARKTLVNEGAITGSGLTQATARLLGRTTASTGAVEEISVGTGLSLSAGSLSATGGGGSLTVEGNTGSPTDSAVTKLVFPSDALSIASHVATIRQVPTGSIGAKAYNSNTQSVAQGGAVALTLDSEDFDTDGFHSTSSNTSRMTIPTGLGGKYLVIAATSWDTSGAGNARLVGVFKNGATVGGHSTVNPNTVIGPRHESSVVLDLVAGDYVEAIVYQDSGANRNVGSASYDTSSQLTVIRLEAGSSARPRCGAKAYNSTTQSITTGSDTVATFDSEMFDTDAFHSTSSNTGRMTVPTGKGGLYLIEHGGIWDTNATGRRYSYLRINGSTNVMGGFVEVTPNSGALPSVSGSVIQPLADGDYVELLVGQFSGGNLNFGFAAADHPRATLGLTRLSD